MVDQRDDIIKFIQNNGPVLPVQIAKHLNTSILFSSAMLSELVDRKILKISHAAVGGSPLYYLPGQETAMDNRLSNSLSGKEKEAYELIKSQKILIEKNLEPWQRIAVKSLKDFTRPINVLIENSQENFWKYHLLDDKEAELLISDYLESIKPQKQLEQTMVKQEVIQEKVQPQIQTKLETPKQEIEKNQDIKIEEEKFTPEIKINIPQTDFKKIEKPELKKKKLSQPSGKFYSSILNYFNENKINIINNELIKKDKEFNLIVDIPSSLGDLRYFVKAKSKPSLNESDISMALGDGKIKNLPIVMFFSGKISRFSC